jgi:phosphoribosylamine-glycine ligase
VTYQEILDQIVDAASKCNVDLTDRPMSPDYFLQDQLDDICKKHGIAMWWDNKKQTIIAKKVLD